MTGVCRTANAPPASLTPAGPGGLKKGNRGNKVLTNSVNVPRDEV